MGVWDRFRERKWTDFNEFYLIISAWVFSCSQMRWWHISERDIIAILYSARANSPVKRNVQSSACSIQQPRGEFYPTVTIWALTAGLGTGGVFE